MNPDTGLLVDLLKTARKDTGLVEPLPARLAREARKELRDRPTAVIDLSKRTPLAAWAKKKRKAKAAAESRRRNRE